MLPFKEVLYRQVTRNSTALLVADIGGTNANFGIAQIVGDDAHLLFSLHVKSKDIKDFTQLVHDLLFYIHKSYGITIKSACFAAAGAVAPKQEVCKPTNLNITIDARDIVKHTSLTCAFIVNDFEVIGYGIDRIDPKDLVVVQRGNEYKHGNKAILGAGTGLGKAILRWVPSKDRYIPVPSEGGHADFSAQTLLDIELIQSIHSLGQHDCNISWENVLSGKGISRIYHFFDTYKEYEQTLTTALAPHPDKIFANRNRDQQCWDTFALYTTYYARCAKNWALDALALGGIYIAGGIAAHNVEMFSLDIFLDEFANCGKQQRLLKSLPIWVIADYNVSLYGAIEYMKLEGKCSIE